MSDLTAKPTREKPYDEVVAIGIESLYAVGATGAGYESLRDYLAGDAMTDEEADMMIRLLRRIGEAELSYA